MNGRACIAAIACMACNQLIGIGTPTLVPDADLALPGCATGWHQHASVTIVNTSMTALTDFQVAVPVDVGRLVADHELETGGSDLRFVAGGQLLAFAVEPEDELVWVDVPSVPVGTSQIDMFFDNLTAPAATTGSPFMQGVLANPSFEQVGGWTMEPPVGPSSTDIMFDAPEWFTDGSGSLYIDMECMGDRPDASQITLDQTDDFPAGSQYVIRFDVNIIAASNGGVDGASDGELWLTLGNDGLQQVWRDSGNFGNITGVYLDQETEAFAAGTTPLGIVARVLAGSTPGYMVAYLDNLRLRKDVTPPPQVTVGSATHTCSM